MPTVLLADTDPDTRRILRDYLGANDFTVVACDTTEGLVECVRRDSPDAVIVEPYVLGARPVELVRAVRAASTRPIPVIVYTSSPWHSDFDEAERLGASILAKPARPARVLLLLDRLLDRTGSNLPPRPPEGDAPVAGA